MPSSPSRQKGIAVLTAMLIMAVAVTVTASLVATLHYDLRLSGNIRDVQQNYLYVEGVEAMVGVLLKLDYDDNQYDGFQDQWNQKQTPIPLTQDGEQIGIATGRLYDLQGKFNLNSVNHQLKDDKTGESKPDPEAEKRLKTFLQLHEQEKLADAVLDWVDSDSIARASGAEHDFYQTSNTPYLAANTPFVSASELHLLRFDNLTERKEYTKTIDKLAEAFTALPEASTPINVNTASEKLLQAYGFDTSQIDSIVNQRTDKPFESKDEFLKTYKPAKEEDNNNEKKETIPWDLLDVKTHYFLLDVSIQIGNTQLLANSLLKRDDKGNTQVIHRTFKYPSLDNEDNNS